MFTTKTLKVICMWGQELGFRLGGAEVSTVSDRESFNKELARIIFSKDVGILAIPAHMEEWISKGNQKALQRCVTPLLARYTYPDEWSVAPDTDKYTREMSFRAIGFHFRINL